MAVYYIDPYTTTNGTGTWASPFSFSTTAHSGLAAGDELRVVAKYLTSLLTATTYTATRTGDTAFLLTVGGGLGADFVAGDYVYFSDYDSFGRVNAVTTNTLTVGAGSGSGIAPIPNTNATTVTIRKVDLTAAAPSATSTTTTLFGVLGNSTSATDGWVADGVRVTDGTAKSIVRSSATSGSHTFRLDLASAGTYYTGVTADIPNTHILGSNNSSGSLSIVIYTTSTVSIGQLYAAGGSTSLTTGNSTSNAIFSNFSFTFKHVSASLSFFQNATMSSSTINITNLYTASGLTPGPGMYKCTVNIGSFISVAFNGNGIALGSIPAPNQTFNIATVMDGYQASTINSIAVQYGSYTINISCPIYTNKRATTITTIDRRFNGTVGGALAYSNIDTLFTPKITASGVTFTNNDSVLSVQLFATQTSVRDTPLSLPRQYRLYTGYDTSGFEPSWNLLPTNLLVTSSFGGSAYELLGIPYASIPTTIVVAGNNFPKVTLDAAVYRTTGPSIKVYLSTYNATYWTPTFPSTAGMSTKNIKIPVVAGTTYTISGYIRTDQTTFTDGHCVVSLTDGFTTTNSQSMTTACINAWEQFTMTYAATITQEINLAISMKFSAGAKAFWIDDITIV